MLKSLTDAKNSPASSKLYVLASKMADGVKVLNWGNREIRLAKKKDRDVKRKAGVQMTTHVKEHFGSDGMFPVERCS